MSKIPTPSPDSHLDHYQAIPLGAQLKAIFQSKINNGEWLPNSMIPSENKLSETYGVSRMTVRNVITQFVSQGYLYRIPGKGTFVSGVKYEFTSTEYAGIRKQLEEQGHSVTTRLVSCEKGPADEYIASRLNLSVGDEVYEIKRIRSTAGLNISYNKSYVPVSMFPDLDKKDLQSEMLCKIMSQDYHVERGRMTEILELYEADKVKAEHLGVKQGFPLLRLQDTLFNAENIPYEFSCIYFRGDKIKIRIEA